MSLSFACGSLSIYLSLYTRFGIILSTKKFLRVYECVRAYKWHGGTWAIYHVCDVCVCVVVVHKNGENISRYVCSHNGCAYVVVIDVSYVYSAASTCIIWQAETARPDDCHRPHDRKHCHGIHAQCRMNPYRPYNHPSPSRSLAAAISLNPRTVIQRRIERMHSYTHTPRDSPQSRIHACIACTVAV